MDDHDWLAQRFETHRTHLRAVAYRMLGSIGEADDAVQEAWLRLSHSDTSGVQNLGGWLTTVVSRMCLDMLRSRRGAPLGEPPPGGGGAPRGRRGGAGGGGRLSSPRPPRAGGRPGPPPPPPPGGAGD